MTKITEVATTEVAKEETAVAVVERNSSIEDSLFGGLGKDFYSSVDTTDRKGAVAVYNAVNGTCESLNDHLNEQLSIKDIVVQKLDPKVNEKTGETTEGYRIVLIDEDGKGYATGATGVLNSIKKLFVMVGTPETWTEPLKLKVVEKNTKQGFKTKVVELI